METARWMLTVLCGLLWLFVVLGNYWAIYVGLRKQKHISPIPLIGTLAGLACLALLPYGMLTTRLWFFPAAMLADPQLWYALVYFAVRGFPKDK